MYGELAVLSWERSRERAKSLSVVALSTSEGQQDLLARCEATSYIYKPGFIRFVDRVRHLGLYRLISTETPKMGI